MHPEAHASGVRRFTSAASAWPSDAVFGTSAPQIRIRALSHEPSGGGFLHPLLLQAEGLISAVAITHEYQQRRVSSGSDSSWSDSSIRFLGPALWRGYRVGFSGLILGLVLGLNLEPTLRPIRSTPKERLAIGFAGLPIVPCGFAPEKPRRIRLVDELAPRPQPSISRYKLLGWRSDFDIRIPSRAATFANVEIKGPPANIGF